VLALPAGVLLAWIAAAALALVATRALRRSRGGSAPRRRLALLHAVPAALGDAVLVVDARGLVVEANDAAADLAGLARTRLVGSGVGILGAELASLVRNAPAGPAPACARVALAPAGGRVRARAAVVRAPGREEAYLAVFRADPPARPPPLPRPARPPAPERGAAPVDAPRPEPAGAAAAATAAALREPLERARTAASLLRLALPAGGTAAARSAAARLEAALDDLGARLGALAPDAPGRRADVDVAALVAEALRALDLPAGVRVRLGPAPPLALATADSARLRRAFAEVLRDAAAAMPRGGELAVAVARRGEDLVVEVSDTGARAAHDGVPLARALLFEQGGRLEQAAVPGRGTVCRIALPAAARADRAFDGGPGGR
jgi:signal transduction histidine kinase